MQASGRLEKAHLHLQLGIRTDGRCQFTLHFTSCPALRGMARPDPRVRELHCKRLATALATERVSNTSLPSLSRCDVQLLAAPASGFG